MDVLLLVVGCSQFDSFKEVTHRRFLVRVRQFVKVVVLVAMPVQAVIYARTAVSHFAMDHSESSEEQLKYIPPLVGFPANLLMLCMHAWPQGISYCKMRLLFTLVLFRQLAVVFIVSQPGWQGFTAAEQLVVALAVLMWIGVTMQDTRFLLAIYSLVLPAQIAHSLATGEDSNLLVLQMLMAALVCVTSAVAESSTLQCIAAEKNAETSQAQREAALSLLSSLCDAVVHLSDSLEIVHGYQTLAGFLLHEAKSSTHARLINFTSLIHDELSKAAFLAMIESAGGVRYAQTLHITLRDRNSIPVAVQIFLASSSDAEGNRLWLVGVREDADEMRLLQPAVGKAEVDKPEAAAAAAAAVAAPAPVQMELPTSTRLPMGARRPSAGLVTGLVSIVESGVADSSGSCSFMNLDTSSDDGEAKVWIEAVISPDHGMRMLKWTPAFINIIGPSAVAQGSDFLNIVADQDDFLARFQPATNDLFYEDEANSGSLPFEVLASTAMHGHVRLLGSLSMPNSQETLAVPTVVFSVEQWMVVQRAWLVTEERSCCPHRKPNLVALQSALLTL